LEGEEPLVHVLVDVESLEAGDLALRELIFLEKGDAAHEIDPEVNRLVGQGVPMADQVIGIVREGQVIGIANVFFERAILVLLGSQFPVEAILVIEKRDLFLGLDRLFESQKIHEEGPIDASGVGKGPVDLPVVGAFVLREGRGDLLDQALGHLSGDRVRGIDGVDQIAELGLAEEPLRDLVVAGLPPVRGMVFLDREGKMALRLAFPLRGLEGLNRIGDGFSKDADPEILRNILLDLADRQRMAFVRVPKQGQ